MKNMGYEACTSDENVEERNERDLPSLPAHDKYNQPRVVVHTVTAA